MNVELRTPSEEEFQLIRDHIKEFELDDRDLQPEQFTAAFINNELAGFGRLRIHDDCIELCSLGVITPLRGMGIGKTVVRALLARHATDIYLTCIIPDFFIPFGFFITINFPDPIQNKLDYCTGTLCVPQKYVAMLRKSNYPTF